MNHIQLIEDESLLIASINRPERLNALNTEVMEEISSAVDILNERDDLKAMIITGSGEKAFAAGADISEFTSMGVLAAESMSASGNRLFKRIEANPQPIIAAVNGFALGGGCELAMACHLRLASHNARFGQPEVNLGLIPGYGGTQRLVQLIGKGRAMYYLLTGDVIEADEAFKMGLVNSLHSQSELLGEAKALAHKITSKGPLAVAKVTEILSKSAELDVDGYREEVRAFGELTGSEDMKEGIQAFLEKRKPEFKNK